jgi:predicted O-methyltransferase YrrM
MTKMWDQQMLHPPTKLYYNKLKELLNTIDFSEVLEIGLDVGISARCILEFPNARLTSVDPGEVDRGIAEINELKAGDRWKFHPIYSDVFFKTCIWMYDVIYIDGDHSYEQVKKDFTNAWKFLKPGGLLIGHDFIHPSNFRNDKDCGVTQAVSEFIIEQNVVATIYPPNPGLITIIKI